MDKFLEFMSGFNLHTIITVAVIFWYFTKDIKGEMKLLEVKIDRQSERTDKLYEMFIDLLRSKNG